MNVGFIGLGRVGLVLALCMERHGGHKVVGYDISPLPAQILTGMEPPPAEEGIQDLLNGSELEMLASVAEVVARSDLVMVCVQTPHPGGWTGSEPMGAPSDFDYSYLCAAVTEVSNAAREQARDVTLVVVSTVLPGTCERLLLPDLPPNVALVYAPSLISLGTVARDFLGPEVVIAGSNEPGDQVYYDYVRALPIPQDTPVCIMSLASAELAKMSYNLMTVAKLSVAGTIMRLAEGCGADADAVTEVLSHGTKRLLSPMYLKAGMPSGGPCLPPGETVITENGPQAIEKVAVGDLVLTIDGTLQPVIKTWESPYDGDLVAVPAVGLPGARMTADHPVMTRRDLRVRMANGRKPTSRFPRSEIEQVPASDLTSDHLVIWPVPQQKHYDLPEHATPEYLELAGWYLSEGCIERSGRIHWDLHIREIAEAERIAELAVICAPKRLNGTDSAVTIRIKPNNGRRVRFGSLSLARRLAADFGEGAKEKRLPAWALWGDEKTARLLLEGMLKGDGHLHPKGVSFSTISLHLAWGCFTLLTRLGCHPNLRVIAERPGHQRSYEVRLRNRTEARQLFDLTNIGQATRPVRPGGTGRLADVDVAEIRRRSASGESLVSIGRAFGIHGSAVANILSGASYRGNGYRRDDWRPVRSLRRERYSGPVHNLWVAGSNTYVTATGAVHNCHPRDVNALAWLARFGGPSLPLDLAEDREAHAEWLAGFVWREHERTGLPVMFLGASYKPGTGVTAGSAAVLVAKCLPKLVEVIFDDLPPGFPESLGPQVFFIGCAEPQYAELEYPEGSVVIDPHGYIPQREGVTLITPGRKRGG